MPENDANDMTRSHVALAAGAKIGHYRIIDKIGAGGMGEVYLAEDTRLMRKVALKFLPIHLAANDDIKSRFLREAQAVAKLNHPNIVTIHDVSEYGGRPYFVMEHVEGQSLHHFAHDESLPVETIIEYAIQICQGIGEAHRAKIIHRDIKTSNIVVDSKGRARLLDFGLAAVAGDDKLTKTGSTLGTVAYMSPEQVSGRDIDHRTDLFSFGVVLYELLAGRTPFRRDNEGATLRAIVQDMPEPLARYRAEVPERLRQVVEKLLEKDRELRYQTAEDVIADLKKLFYDSQQTGHYRSVTGKKSKSKAKWAAVAAVAMLVIAAGLVFILKPKADRVANANALPMIAVLPFENLGNPEDEYFADGMTEEITSRLAGIDGLGVISRTSAMQYKATDKGLNEIGKELGVEYVLEGSVRWAKVGGQARVRITPQLIRVSDDRHVWADNYERDLMEVFAVQADIAAQIVKQLGLTLLDSDRTALASRPTTNSQAYDYYLKGINGIRRGEWTTPAMTKVTAVFDSAVAIDPKFALAYAFRSRAYSILAFESQDDDDRRKARESFERALELQPDIAQGHMAAGIYYNLVKTDYERALEEFNLAKGELHNDADLIADIALVQMRQGDFDQALENYRKAAEVDPLNPATHARRSVCQRFVRQFAEADQSIDRAIALDPARAEWYVHKMWGYISRYGDASRLIPVVQEALEHADTLDVIAQIWPNLERFPSASEDSILSVIGFSSDELFDRYQRECRNRVDTVEYYATLAMGYYDRGDSALMAAYGDSVRTLLAKELKAHPDDAHRASALGLALAYSDACEEAEEWGMRGEEMLSIAKCHW